MWSSWSAWCMFKLCRWPFSQDPDPHTLFLLMNIQAFKGVSLPKIPLHTNITACWVAPVQQRRAVDRFMLKSCRDLTWQESHLEFHYLRWSTHTRTSIRRCAPKVFIRRMRLCSLCACCLFVCLWTFWCISFFLQRIGLSIKGILLGDVNSETVLCFTQYAVIWSRAAKCNWANGPLKCAVIGWVWRLFWQSRLWREETVVEATVTLEATLG